MGGRLRRYAVRGALLLAVGLLGLALVREWHDVARSARELGLVTVVLAVAAVTAAVGVSVLAWRALLAGLGAPLPLRAATRIFFVGQLGKYLPGSVWPVLAQMELSRDHGVSRVQAATASLVLLGLAVPSGGLVAAATLPVSSPSALDEYGWVLLVVPVTLVVLHPAVLGALLDRVLALLRRPPLPQRLALPAVATAAGWTIAGYLAYGVGVWLLARDLDAGGGAGRLLLLSLGGYALAWTAGFLVIVVPAGAGVREAVLVLALSPVLSVGAATLLALIARLLATVADLIWAGVGLASRPRPVPPAPDSHKEQALPG